MTLIYVLEKNGIPFYVGKTVIENSRNRFNSHTRNHKCDVFIVDKVENREWKFWEKYYISLYKSWGFELENKNNGGGGPTVGVIFSEKRNQKISKSQLGNQYRLGTSVSEETKQKISKAKIGISHTLETKQKISQSKTGTVVTEETKIKKSIAMKGKKHTNNTKEKMRIASLGKPKSPEHIQNMMKNRENVILGTKLALSKPIIQKDLEGNIIKEWSSVTEAKKEFKGDIYACCNGRQRTAGGFYWEYL